ncbi:hypothetical protein CGZ92_00765 [Parenemella sanctibonifatiensis]|uniref:SURF1-like protein n=1 Tax=Parenemella sanctibonifatiensis TaxID=2016505 RepID=A0A255EMN2_9ACTN|nr:hypothetical protein CGZ92_00765 [Parenemella sanctibonifatiensis]
MMTSPTPPSVAEPGPEPESPHVRRRWLLPTLIIALGVVAASIMVGLGLWQAQVFVDQGLSAADSRAQMAPEPLEEYAPIGGPTGDIYGRPVTTSGVYDSTDEVLIPDHRNRGFYRVLTKLVRDDGTVVPVVRGTVTDPASVPAPPAGVQQVTGIFLPSEPDLGAVPEGQLSSVRLSLLAQTWPETMVSGFVTAQPQLAAAYGMDEAPVELPSGEGSGRNQGYALQWWVFAAFALGMSIKIARDISHGQNTLGGATGPAGAGPASPTQAPKKKRRLGGSMGGATGSAPSRAPAEQTSGPDDSSEA